VDGLLAYVGDSDNVSFPNRPDNYRNTVATPAAVGADRAGPQGQTVLFASNGDEREHPNRAPAASGTERALSVDFLREFWIRAADREDPSDQIDWLEELLRRTRPDEAVLMMAHQVLEDLRALRTWRENPGSVLRDGAYVDPKERIDRLRHILRYSDDNRAVGDALRTLGAMREEVAVEAILAVGELPEPAQRVLRLESLWRMAADGSAANAAIREGFEHARYALYPEEALVAERALADLDRLDALKNRLPR